jgi:hypothetical protein
MRERILRFLTEVDLTLVGHATQGQRLDLYVIGKAAVILFYGGDRAGVMTSDIDVVQISHPPVPLLSIALKEFGRGSTGAKEHDNLYLESVPIGFPPLAASFRKRCTLLGGDWRVLLVWRPDANDLAASKLKRFAAKDQEDLRHLCDLGVLQVENLRSALEGAFLWETEESGDSDRERAFANLERVIAYLLGDSANV